MSELTNVLLSIGRLNSLETETVVLEAMNELSDHTLVQLICDHVGNNDDLADELIETLKENKGDY